MHSTKKSLSINNSKFKTDFPELKFSIVSKQADSKARRGMSYVAFHEIFDSSVKKYYKLNSELIKWNGFIIYSIDGRTILVPNSEENLKIFGTNPNQYNKNAALASISVLSMTFRFCNFIAFKCGKKFFLENKDFLHMSG